jgi:alpha-glucosidase
MRPLFYEFPADPATYELSDQFMLGPALLAAPMVEPGAEYRHVYFPAGDWYDWWSGERFVGPQHLLVHAPLDHLPLFARGGAIVPCGPAMAHTSEKPLDPLILHFYPGNGSFQLYEDDGVTLAYQRGACCTTTYRLHQENERTHLHISARQGNYEPPARNIELRCYKPDGRLLHHEFVDDGAEHQIGF